MSNTTPNTPLESGGELREQVRIIMKFATSNHPMVSSMVYYIAQRERAARLSLIETLYDNNEIDKDTKRYYAALEQEEK